MEKLHKEPDVSRQDYYAFINELKLFHQNRGTPYRQLPKINGREIDLQKLYNQVIALGGLQKVIDHDKWDYVIEELKLPKSCANFSLGLRQIYIRYLGHYEKIHFMGEVPDHDKIQSTDSHNRKLQLNFFHQVPMVYNTLQHDITDLARSASALNRNFVFPTDYDKLCMSLISGLPNEQELALNVCTILSNEGNYMLHLEQCPKLVSLLIAQAGIWSRGETSLKFLFLQSWKGLKGRKMQRFWKSTLDLRNTLLVQLLDIDLGECNPDDTLLNLETDLGSLNIEGQRVLRVALILHNLSFEKNNVPVLVSNSNFIRFLLLSIYSSWTNLKQTAYDTLSNIASEIKLSIEKDISSRLIFETVMKGIQSPDRYMNIRSMDILSQLCNYEPNEDIIPSQLDAEAYQHMVSFLSVHDIMLMFYALEALYALSDLGRYACERIVCVHRSIGVLVSLLTLDPSQYGPSGQIKMKVIETLVPSECDELEEKCENPPEIPKVTINQELDSETFASNWLKATFEPTLGCVIPRNEMYVEYVGHCTKTGCKNVVNANVFAGYLKNTFPLCGMKRIESGNGIVTFYHEGLKRKKIITSQTGPPTQKPVVLTSTPHKVSCPSTPTSSKSGHKPTHSPILKAQLSAPPRSGVTSPPLKRLAEHAANSQKPSHPSSHIAAGSSTLIKSLLANKVQQRNLQRQVVPQALSKMVIYSTDKSSLLRSPLVRCGRPGAFSTPVRTPIQARIISNNRRIIASGPSKLLKYPLLSPAKSPTKFTKQCTPRLNGVLKDLHLEECNQEENFKVNSQASLTNNIQNHINSESTDSKSCDTESFLSSKHADSESDKHLISPDKTFYRINNEFIPSSKNLLIMKPKASNDTLLSHKEQNGCNVTFVNSSDVVSGVVMVTQPTQPKIAATDILNSDLNNLNMKINDMSEQLYKDKICKKAPLLNGLLDKGKVQLSEDIHSLSWLQNGNFSKIRTSECELKSQPLQSASASTIRMSSISPSSQNSVTKLTSLLCSSSVLCNVSSQNSTVQTSLNSTAANCSMNKASPNSRLSLPNLVTTSSMNTVLLSSPLSNSTVSSKPLISSVLSNSSTSVLNDVIISAQLSSFGSQSSSTLSTSDKSHSNLNVSSSTSMGKSTSNQSNSIIIPSLDRTELLNSTNEISLNSNETTYMPAEPSTNSKADPLLLSNSELSSNLTLQSALNSTIEYTASSSIMPSISILSPSSNSTLSPPSTTSILNSSVCFTHSNPSAISPTVLPSTAFSSDNSNLVQICTGQATLSGTIEVQPDQKGVVRLHIESPENSNQGSDLSSISDIARTLECASKAISKTNAECTTQVSDCGTCETAATVTVITTNTSTVAQAGQQFIVVTPALNQPQLHIQSPNIKFRILHSIPKAEESNDLVHVKLNQHNQNWQPLETPSIPNSTLKRPSSDTTSILTEIKKPRIDTKTPLLEATLRLSNPVPYNVASTSVNITTFQENQSILTKPHSESMLSPKLSTTRAIPVQTTDFPCEKESKTFSGLSSACDNPSLAVTSQVSPKSLSSKLEFLCEWKECGQKFPNPGSVFLHASKFHVPTTNEDTICLWEGCDSMRRKRFSLLTHLQDWHCNEKVLHVEALRRKQLSQQGKTTISPPQMPPPHPGYAPDAAFLAIRRHALQYINPKELSEEKENALTKSIRLTSALILRNLVTHSSLARTYVRRFEPELAYLAMSPVESARTIAQCLSQLSRPHD
ncbi:AT-rich interactive domain-containing protein 2 isoform X1 [Parasteatoda tepidariorum]|nr:AT-rich interactive domain-containing protein 2 isoform X2 [Parasteatoda tepidariorum]